MATDRPGRAGPAPDSAPAPPGNRPDDGRPNDDHPDDGRPADGHPDDGHPDDEQRSRGEAYADLRRADHAPVTADDPHTAADGAWSWKSLRLSPADNRVADQQLAARRDAEGRRPDGSYDDRGITPALRRVEAQLEHGTLVPDTEKFALKGPDRFKEKLAKIMRTEPDRSATDLAAEIHDGIRYTYILGFDHYSSEVDQARRLLGEGGYEQIAFKPSWARDEYKGINTQWRDPDSGHIFEVQFHTQDSWEAKQKTHAAYEKIESPQTTAADRAKLREYQRDVSTQVPIPPGALDFVPYRQRGSMS